MAFQGSTPQEPAGLEPAVRVCSSVSGSFRLKLQALRALPYKDMSKSLNTGSWLITSCSFTLMRGGAVLQRAASSLRSLLSSHFSHRKGRTVCRLYLWGEESAPPGTDSGWSRVFRWGSCLSLCSLLSRPSCPGLLSLHSCLLQLSEMFCRAFSKTVPPKEPHP